MTTLTNSEGKILNYTNEFVETILLQLNSSNNYYTTGDDDVIFIKIGSTKALLLDYTYHINRNIFQNYIINENIINNYGLEFILNNTSNEYDLQSVYNGNSYIGIITELSQVFLAIYDISISPSSYTGSENIDITNNEISLSFPLTINNEAFLNPRVNGYYDIYSAPNGISLLQHSSVGSQPIAIFKSLDKSVEFFGDLAIPNHYNKTEIDTFLTNTNLTGSENLDITNNQISLNFPLTINNEPFLNPRVNGYFEIYAAPNGISLLQHSSDGSQPIAIFNSLDKSVEFFGDLDIPNHYNKSSIDTLFSNIDLSNHYTKTEVDDIDNELSALILNTYTKTEVDTQLTDYTTLSYLQSLLNDYATISLIDLNFYDKAYLDNQFSLKADASTTVTTDYLTTNYTNTVALTSGYYNKTETDNMLLSYSTGSYVDYNLYNENDTDN